MTTVTDLQETDKLFFARGVYNIIDCGTRTGKTYWAVNNLQKFTRDGQLNRVLYLVDTNSLKDQILAAYGETCVDADLLWEHPTDWGESVNKIGIMCYQALGMRGIREGLDFLDDIDVICWDECDSIFDFATAAFQKARTTDFARKNTSNSEILNIIQEYSSKKEYMPLILLGLWERIINGNRILCVGLSASPERAKAYYTSLVQASNTGKLEAGFRMAADIYFTNILEHIKRLQPTPGHGYWCYSPFIEPNQGIVAAARAQGFSAIELHSLNNTDKPMTEEQKRVYNCIVATGMVPMEYDFVVVNKALARGINIHDRRFDTVIINSFDSADRIQAARQTFEYQRHLKTFAPEIDKEYLNRWVTVDECRVLAASMQIPELDKANKNTNRYMTWNKLKDYLPAIGYTVLSKRKMINGKQQQAYFITGEWHDAEVRDNEFLTLVDAKLKEE